MTSEYRAEAYVRGYHAYKDSWPTVVGQHLETRPEDDNPVDRFAVAVLIEDKIVGHLPKGKLGRYAKTISYFLKARGRNSCTVIVTGNAVNLGDKMGMQVPCQLLFNGAEDHIRILQQELANMEV